MANPILRSILGERKLLQVFLGDVFINVCLAGHLGRLAQRSYELVSWKRGNGKRYLLLRQGALTSRTPSLKDVRTGRQGNLPHRRRQADRPESTRIVRHVVVLGQLSRASIITYAVACPGSSSMRLRQCISSLSLGYCEPRPCAK